jgi:hypothetical protein
MGTSDPAIPVRPLKLWDAESEQPLFFEARRLFLAGFTGRDRAAVQRHINELAQQGVPVPSRVPECYTVDASSLQVGGTVGGRDGNSSGEVEYVLLNGEDDLYVTVGSDHTDRQLETLSIEKSKSIYPKVLAREVWKVESLLARWDQLILRSSVVDGEKLHVYQTGSLRELITVQDLQKLVGSVIQPGTVIFSGTLPLIDSRIRFASRFIGELITPEGTVLSRCAYDISINEKPL